MTFKNRKHAERFFEATAKNKIGISKPEMLAAIYLLTCRRKLWDRFKDHIVDGEFDVSVFDNFEADNQIEEALVSAASDVLYSTDCISILDLTEKDTIPDEAFMAIYAMICYFRTNFQECPVRDITEIDLKELSN